MLTNLLNFAVNTKTACTPTGRVYVCTDAVIVSVVPLLNKRPEKLALPLCNFVAELERFFRVVQ